MVYNTLHTYGQAATGGPTFLTSLPQLVTTMKADVIKSRSRP